MERRYAPIGRAIPDGGTSGQVLTKGSDNDFDTDWSTPATVITDHGGLTGLGDDDHTQYLLATGARDLTGSLKIQEIADPGLADADEVWLHAQDVAGITQLHYNNSVHKWTLAQDNWVVARNTSGATIDAGKVVTVTGSTGSRPEYALADADNDHTVLGITAASAANNGYASVVTQGYVTGLDTSSFTAGDVLYLSQTAGAMTTTPPAVPAFRVEVGTVISAHATQGIILVAQHESAVVSNDDVYMSTTDRVLGRDTAGAGAAEELTASNVLDWVGSTRGSILYRGASGWAALTPGTSGHVLTSNGAGADPSYQAAGGGFPSPGYTSAETTIATGMSFTHSLGAIPTMWMVVLRCKTADKSYVAGDEVLIHSSFPNANTPWAVTANSTTIYVNAYTTTIYLVNRGGGTTGWTTPITNGNWKVVVYAWA